MGWLLSPVMTILAAGSLGRAIYSLRAERLAGFGGIVRLA
jgi:hypothetical protein